MQDYKLIFVGHGFLPGIPARDLTKDEVDRLHLRAADLIGSGLWIKVIPKQEPGEQAGSTMEVDDARN